MAEKKGVSFYDGAEMPSVSGDKSTMGSDMATKSGGPIMAPDGVDDGHSSGDTSKISNSCDVSAGKGSPISGPMDV